MSDNPINQKFEHISAMISNTPMLEIRFLYKEKPYRIFAKAEYYNLTGSIKDRVAYYILKKAYENGTIHPGDVIAEATSGNTGISFSAMGSYLGHPVIIYMPDWMSREPNQSHEKLWCTGAPGFTGRRRIFRFDCHDGKTGARRRCISAPSVFQ